MKAMLAFKSLLNKFLKRLFVQCSIYSILFYRATKCRFRCVGGLAPKQKFTLGCLIQGLGVVENTDNSPVWLASARYHYFYLFFKF